MRSYSAEFKASLIAKMLPPHHRPVPDLARETQIPRDTLYRWRTQRRVDHQRIKQLEQEVGRRDKALAEAAVLLMPQQKAGNSWRTPRTPDRLSATASVEPTHRRSLQGRGAPGARL